MLFQKRIGWTALFRLVALYFDHDAAVRLQAVTQCLPPQPWAGLNLVCLAPADGSNLFSGNATVCQVLLDSVGTAL